MGKTNFRAKAENRAKFQPRALVLKTLQPPRNKPLRSATALLGVRTPVTSRHVAITQERELCILNNRRSTDSSSDESRNPDYEGSD